MIAATAHWALAIFLVAFALALAMGAMIKPTSPRWQAFAYFITLAMCVAALLLVASA